MQYYRNWKQGRGQTVYCYEGYFHSSTGHVN